MRTSTWMILVDSILSRLRTLTGAVLVLAASLWVTGCEKGPQELVMRGQIFGTTWMVRAVALPEKQDKLQRAIAHALESQDRLMSSWHDDSELARLNALGAATEPGEFSASRDMAMVLDISHEVWLRSGGAFDPSVGPLVDLWGFGEKVPAAAPAAAAVSAALQATGFGDVQLLGERVRFKQPRQLKLGAVAKGYAVDKIAMLLAREKLKNYLVEVGGEVFARGYRPDGRPWQVGVQNPASDGGVYQVVSLTDRAMATSGDYYNRVTLDGKSYQHTIDPRTGYPVESPVVSVSVIAPNTALADAWATALMVIGPADGLKLADREGLGVLFLSRADDGSLVESSNKIFQMH